MTHNTAVPLVRIVDSDRQWCEALRTRLSFRGLFVKTYESVESFEREDDHERAGCVVLDAGSVPTWTGIELLNSLKDEECALSVVMTAQNATIDLAVDAMKAGAVDFIARPVDEMRVVEIVERCIEEAIRAQSLRKFVADFSVLSGREREVIELSSEGMSHDEVAKRLGISVKTAQVHRYNAYRKLGHHNITEIFQMMTKAGLVA